MSYADRMINFLNGMKKTIDGLGCPECGTPMERVEGGMAQCENGHVMPL